MKKSLRLKSAADFKKAFREGRAVKSPHFILYIRPNSLDSPRIGFSFSRSSIKLATRRNRLRRIIRELWRKEIAAGLGGLDMVLVAKRQPAAVAGEIRAEIRRMFDRIG